MEQCEVLIVGAGPAGSTCARILSKWGIPVLLMDRDPFPRDKPCAGWITPPVLETLRIDREEYRRGRLLQEIRAFRTRVMSGGERLTDYGKTVSYAIRRSEFDDYLLRRHTGRTLLGEPVQALERTTDGWLVNGRIRARLLVGAGGHSCPVARALGARPEREEALVALVAEYELTGRELAGFPLVPGYTSLAFTTDCEGYGWLLRKGNFLNLGLGNLGGRDLRRRLSDYWRRLRREGALTADPVVPFRGHAYLPYKREGGRRLLGDRALVIGDAAGLAYPSSGEGILPAVESAIMAAQTILCASGDYRPGWLEPYPAAVAARFGGRGIHWDALRLPAGFQGAGARLLLSSGWLTRHLILDRFFLHRGVGALVPRAEQALEPEPREAASELEAGAELPAAEGAHVRQR